MKNQAFPPLVSVLVTTYNQENYIVQAIESIMMQVCNFSFEIVIGEDCSTDNTRQICIELQKKYPEHLRLILNPQNEGLIKNFYNTLSHCRGKYMAECAGDDFWNDPYKLQKQVDILENDPAIVLVHTAWNELYNGKLSIRQKLDPLVLRTGKEYTKQLMNQTTDVLVYTCSACYRRETIEEIRKRYPPFFSNNYPCEDYQLVFFLLQAGDFYYLNESTITYRVLSESASHSSNPEKIFHFKWGVLQLHIDIFNELKLNVLDASVYLKWVSHSLLLLSFKAKRKDLAEKANQTFREIGFQISFTDKLLLCITENKFLFNGLHSSYLLMRKIRRSLRKNRTTNSLSHVTIS